MEGIGWRVCRRHPELDCQYERCIRWKLVARWRTVRSPRLIVPTNLRAVTAVDMVTSREISSNVLSVPDTEAPTPDRCDDEA